jgi:hypothetical protein
MGPIGSSETPVFDKPAMCNVPEDGIILILLVPSPDYEVLIVTKIFEEWGGEKIVFIQQKVISNEWFYSSGSDVYIFPGP